uniref:SUEL-type lectin domain-containing protein n=1 Tax=Salarias fasciatus TaxID=181472 RepID=A0A672GUL0_SALFA
YICLSVIACLTLVDTRRPSSVQPPDIGVIRVQTALYGRRNREMCSEGKPPRQLANIRCSAKDTLQRVKSRCDNRKVCEINQKDIGKSDPCRGIYKYVETTYTCLPASQFHVIACEHSMAFLYCDVGQVIHIYGARFGRGDKAICAYRRPARLTKNVWCSNPSNKVAARCNGKQKCSIKASKSSFGDPCRGTYKYLEVAYVCLCK